jgi:DNA-binding Lrp family transcriptional regulator
MGVGPQARAVPPSKSHKYTAIFKHPMPLDDVDRQILAILRDNARESYTDIAEDIGTSEGTVRSRIKKLVDEGTIQKFTVRTSGNLVKALVEVSVTSNVHSGEVAKTIRGWEGVESVWEVTGDNDIVVVADCVTTAFLNTLIDRIREIPGTQATRSRLILKEH